MKKEDIIKIVEKLDKHIGLYQIEIGLNSNVSFIIGCFYDDSTSTWKTYKNDERGIQFIISSSQTEELIYDNLNALINKEKKILESL